MKQVNLGSLGLRVPAVGLGCMGMSDFYGSSSEAQNLRVLDRAADIGWTFWDTADMYGPFKNEILLSKALKGRRDKITLAWVLSRDLPISAIPGTRSAERLEENWASQEPSSMRV